MLFYNSPTPMTIIAFVRARMANPDNIRLRSTSSDYPILSDWLSALSAAGRVGEVTQ